MRVDTENAVLVDEGTIIAAMLVWGESIFPEFSGLVVEDVGALVVVHSCL